VQSLRGLFDELIDLSPEDRERRLEELALAPKSVGRLRAMLDAAGGSPPLLAIPVSEIISTLRDDEQLLRSLIGQKIGPFRILQLIAEGGTSAVFRAERGAGLGTQTVALKLLLVGHYSPDAQRRFLREQAILAQLSHPDIARLIEGGVSDTGPYIAMEYVDGMPLTYAADAQKLDLNARLKLFVRLCRAVDAAHASLIVHCDLKPSNVLVDSRGALKVLDFGIARLMSGGDRLTSGLACTPEYAAPEQTSREAPTVATDIFALGIILTELLTGKRMRDAETMPASALVREISNAESSPGLPPPKTLARKLEGDLDAIIRTALAKHPTSRFRSADAMATDIERHINGYPISVRRSLRWYVAQRFVARNRLAAALVFSLIIGIVVSLAVAVDATRSALYQATIAEATAARADSLRDFMFEAFTDAEPGAVRSGPPTIVDAVERALASVLARHDTDPRVRIELQTRLAQVLSAQGALPRAGEIFQDAESFAAAHLESTDPLLLNLEQLTIQNRAHRGSLNEARTEIDALLERLPLSQTGIRIDALTTSSFLAGRMHAAERSVADAREAVRLARGSGDDYRLDLALHALGSALLISSNPSEAVPIYEDLLVRQKARYGAEHIRVAAEHASLSRAYDAAGNLDRSEQHARAALSIDDKVFTAPHPDKATHLNALMMVQGRRRDFEGALKTAREAYEIDRSVNGEAHYDTLIDCTAIANYAGLTGAWDEAMEWSKRAVDGHVKRGTERNWFGVKARMIYALALAETGQVRQGQLELERTFALANSFPQYEADTLRALAMERKVRISLDSGNVAQVEEDIARFPEKLNAEHQAHLALLRAEIALRNNGLDECLMQLDIADASARQMQREDPLLGTTASILRAVALKRRGTRSQESLNLATNKFTELHFPPAFLAKYMRELETR